MMKYSVGCIAMVTLTFGVQADDSLWKVVSGLSPTVLPAYAGQPSPFPHIQVAPVAPVSSTEEIEHAQRRDELLSRATALLASPQAFTPWVQGIRTGGQMAGLAGPRVLVGEDWVGKGQLLAVRVTLSPRVSALVGDLQTYDRDMALDINRRFEHQLTAHPTTSMKIQGITSKELTLKSDVYGTFSVPLSAQDE